MVVRKAVKNEGYKQLVRVEEYHPHLNSFVTNNGMVYRVELCDLEMMSQGRIKKPEQVYLMGSVKHDSQRGRSELPDFNGRKGRAVRDSKVINAILEKWGEMMRDTSVPSE